MRLKLNKFTADYTDTLPCHCDIADHDHDPVINESIYIGLCDDHHRQRYLVSYVLTVIKRLKSPVQL